MINKRFRDRNGKLTKSISEINKESLEREAQEKGTNFSNLIRMILVEREKDKQK